MSGTHAADCGCEGASAHEHFARESVDNGAWDGSAAMSKCANSDTPASCYGSICAGRKAGDPSKQDSWALPHHANAGGPPNAAGVRNALSRLPQTQGLTNRAAAEAHLNAHMKSISGGTSSARKPGYEPRNALVVRAIWPGYELREASNGQGMPTLTGHFAVFNRWTEIDSFWEGEFLESIAPGAFARTFKNDRAGMRVLFQHGRDPIAGSKPLGPIEDLREDDQGAYYEVPLLDTSYNKDLLPGLRNGLYGASFRFRVMKEQVTEKPDASEHNPKGIPERVIQEAQVMEFGPVTFPAYADATAGVRSLTDEFILEQFGMDADRLHTLLHHQIQPSHATALSDGHDDARSDSGTRDDSPTRLVVVKNPNRRRQHT
jgi:HK97 family phage prohead protease